MTTTPHVQDYVKHDFDLTVLFGLTKAKQEQRRYRIYHLLFVVAYIPLLIMIPLALFVVHDNMSFWLIVPGILYIAFWHHRNTTKLDQARVAVTQAETKYIQHIEHNLKAGIGDTSKFEQYFNG